MHNRSRYGLGVVALLVAGVVVYGFIVRASAQGPGWREILPRQSIGERWREGKPNSRTPQPPRPKPVKPR